MTIQSRLYSPSTQPTVGFGVPAFTLSSLTNRAVFFGVVGLPALTQGFRSNAGVFNANSFPVTVTMALFDGTGNPVGTSFVRTAAANEAFQVSNVVATLAGSSASLSGGVLVVLSTGGGVLPYMTVVDNVSQDAFYVIPSADEPPVP